MLIIKTGLLTFKVILRATAFSTQPLEERSHHLGTTEALEAGTNVFVVPLQSTNLENPVKGNAGHKIGSNDFLHWSVTNNYRKYLWEHKHSNKDWVRLFCHTKQEQEMIDCNGELTKLWSAALSMRCIAWYFPDIGWVQWKGFSVLYLIEVV